MLLTTAILTSADQAVEATSQTAPLTDIIGIGGIIATVVVGLVTCLVTWKLTMKSIKQRKLTYNIQVYPILSNSVSQNSEINFDDLEIKYRDKPLQNPCLLTLEIANVGNEAIERPPIRISNSENIEIIPGYFEKVPRGYEDLWHLKKSDQYTCNVELEHINPKQIVKARFFLDNLPREKISFECPMPNIQTQEIAYNDTHKAALHTTSYSRANLILIAITVLLFMTIEQWSYTISDMSWNLGICLPRAGVAAFTMAIFILTVLFNTYGLPKVDMYLKTHAKYSLFTKIFLVLVSMVLLSMIVFDYIIVDLVPQMIAAIVVAVFLALLLHFSIITKKNDKSA